MKLDLSVAGDIVIAMQAEILAGEKAVTAAMRAAGGELKSNWRAQVTRAPAWTTARKHDPVQDLSCYGQKL